MKVLFILFLFLAVSFSYPVQTHYEYMRPFGTDVMEFEKDGQIHKIRVGSYVKKDKIIVYDNKCKQDQTLVPYGEQYKLQLCNGVYVSYISDYYINKEYTPTVKFFLTKPYETMDYRGKWYPYYFYAHQQKSEKPNIVFENNRFYVIRNGVKMRLK